MRFLADGRIVEEWTTLVDPRCDVGPTFIHRISNTDVMGAPAFGDVASEVAYRLRGAIAVGHNASFDGRFLGSELRRVSGLFPALPALCTIEVQQQLDPGSERIRLRSAAEKFGVAAAGSHSALGDARVVAQLFCAQLRAAEHWGRGGAISVSVPALVVDTPASMATPKIRVVDVRRGERGWLAGVIDRLPLAADRELGDVGDRYLTLLGDVLADGKVSKVEADEVAALVGGAGMSATQVVALNRRFLESLRETALADGRVTKQEIASLRKAAAAVGEAAYFDDLDATTTTIATTASVAAGQLTGVRLVVIGDNDDADRIRSAAAEAGATVAVNVTKTVTAVIDVSGSTTDRKVERARQLGIAVLTAEEAHEEFWQRSNSAPSSSTPTRPPAGWYQDPLGRNEHRYWDGAAWTAHVANLGTTASDPL